MPDRKQDCDLPEILSVRAREILFPARKRRVAVELTVTGRNLPEGGPPTTVRVGEHRLRNLEWLDRNTLRGVLIDRPQRPVPVLIEFDYHPVASWKALDPDAIERL